MKSSMNIGEGIQDFAARVPPSGQVTTLAMNEELQDGGICRPPCHEHTPPPRVTTLAVGEECQDGGISRPPCHAHTPPDAKTIKAVGEEGQDSGCAPISLKELFGHK